MNPFAIFIIAAILLDYLLELIANLLNLKALKSRLPSILQDVYSPEVHAKSQKYIGSMTRFNIVESSFTLAVVLSFWFIKGFGWLDRIISNWDFTTLVHGLIYIGLLVSVYSLLKLPFSIYHTFVIEERFGFNRSSVRTFCADLLKGALLALILGAPVLAGILALFQYVGVFAWVYCWIAVTALIVAMQYVAPVWIMPLYNKYTTLESGVLRDAIFKYAKSVNFSLKNVLVMDGSKRSSKSNAFFTGFGGNKRIALFDTLIAKHTVPEMVSILAHEVGHYKKKHIPQGIVISILHTGVLLFLLSTFIGNSMLYEAFYMSHEPVYAGLVFFMLLYTPVELVLAIALQMLSRKNEYEADRFAVETVEKPGIIVDALKKLSSTNLSNLTPHPFYVFLNYSHPPLYQRIQAIQNLKIIEEAPTTYKD